MANSHKSREDYSFKMRREWIRFQDLFMIVTNSRGELPLLTWDFVVTACLFMTCLAFILDHHTNREVCYTCIMNLLELSLIDYSIRFFNLPRSSRVFIHSQSLPSFPDQLFRLVSAADLLPDDGFLHRITRISSQNKGNHARTGNLADWTAA